MKKIAAGLIALLCATAHAEEPMQITNVHKTIASQTGWLNTSRAITPEDLQGRIILLDFWTYCCINCMHVIPDLKYLEEKFGSDLTVIGVHSAKFQNERDTENIRSAILRYDLHHPVVNDFDFSVWKKFGVNAWPTFILINPQGTIEHVYSGEGNRAAAEEDIEKLREKYKGKFVTAELPVALEKDKKPASELSFPGKLAYTDDLGGEAALIVSDSGHNQILVMKPNGEIKFRVGSGVAGNKDGDFNTAQFHAPQGVSFFLPSDKDHVLGKIYVADTENHLLREIDLDKGNVTTIAGTGKQGYDRSANNAPALSTPLASPWDVTLYPDATHLTIAMAGTHQLWSYDIDKKTVSVIAGNGRESIDDGKYPFNSLSQPSGLSVADGKLYFVDSETSSLRVFEGGNIETLIGTGLFDFGFKDGVQGEAKMQHAIGVFADGKNIFVADSYNHSIRRYDTAQKRLQTFAGHGVRGNKDGQPMAAEFNEPNDVQKIGNTLYVADTNNNAIRTIDLNTGRVGTMKISKAAATQTVAFATDLPNLEKTPAADIAASTTVSLALQKGWHINDAAPSTMTLFDAKKKAVKTFGLSDVKTRTLPLPKLTEGTYHLQATLYYCRDEAGSQCLIKSFDQLLHVKADEKKELVLKLN